MVLRFHGKQTQVSVPPEDMDAAFQVPAPGANKFVVTLGMPGLRIAFGEDSEHIRKPYFHTAVTLHPMDGIVLYQMLAEMLVQIETEFRASGVISDEKSDG